MIMNQMLNTIDGLTHIEIISSEKIILKKGLFQYDLAADPQSYLKSMFYINKQIELFNENNEYPIKLFQVIPQRTSIIPKHICIDSCALVDLSVSEGISEYLKHITDHRHNLWKSNFKITRNEFKRRNYAFNYMIRTDGISCSIILIKLENGEPITITKNMQKELKKKIRIRIQIYRNS